MIGFLHTAEVHVATFRDLCAELAPDWDDRHVVDESLLARARVDGVTPEVVAALRARLSELSGADVIVCTCSTIGAAAEGLDGAFGVPLMRVDRPMADAAVAAGGRIAVAFALESTWATTGALIRDSAVRAGREVTLTPVPCLSAWPFFEAGDLPRYHRTIADRIRTTAGDVDVTVLAQASMTPAAGLLPGVPVLSSPRTAVAAAVQRVRNVRYAV